jgi:hypothetical protein
VIARAFDPSGQPDRMLRGALWIMTGIVVVLAVRDLLAAYPVGVDVEIPLRAARRWLDGGQPYLAASFQAPVGPDLPFFYPPFVLPVIAPLVLLPGGLVVAGWLAAGVAAAAWTCRRLSIPWRWLPFVLLWPPFFEGLIGGNIQVVLFAAFVGLLYRRPAAKAAFNPTERLVGEDSRPAWLDGLLAVVNGAMKPAQAHPWFLVLRRRPRAALLGAGIVVIVIAISLVLTGPGLWFDWFAQLARGSDPDWPLGGAGLTHGLPASASVLLAAATMIAALALPQRGAVAWLGILMIVGSPSLRMFGLLLLLPAMLVVRREVALVAALSVATYTMLGLWLGVAVVGIALAAGSRWPAWLEPGGPTQAATTDVARKQ